MEIASTRTGARLRGSAAKSREILQYFLAREELPLRMRAPQFDYAHGTIDAHLPVLLAPRDGIQFSSFLSEKVSPDFLPGNGFDFA